MPAMTLTPIGVAPRSRGAKSSAFVGTMKPSPRVIIYMRQSQEKAQTITFENQEASAREWLRIHPEATLVDIIRDEDKTGRNLNRPGLQAIIERITAGEIDVVLVWKVSRFGRNLLDSLTVASDLEDKGAEVVSATQPVDRSTSTGKFIWHLLLAQAQLESDQIGDVWTETHMNRVSKGLPHSGGARFGYTRSGGLHHPDPVTGPLLAEMYQRYNDGQSIAKIAQWMNTTGVQTMAGEYNRPSARWTAAPLRMILDKGFGAGLIAYDGNFYQGQHEPVIDMATWEQYRAARARRSQHGFRQRERGRGYMFTGLLYCGICGTRMNASTGSNGYVVYRCRAMVTNRAHTGGVMAEKVILEEVEKWLSEAADAIQGAFDATPVLAAAPAPERRSVALQARKDQLTARLDAALTRHLDDPELMTPAQYQRIKDQTEQELGVIAYELQQAVADEAGPELEVALLSLWETWAEMSTDERREGLRLVTERIVVKSGRPRGTVTIEGKQ